MHPLLAIVRAAHCRSTHHYFAIDALPLVETDAGKRLAKHLMRHHDRYLTGAKDPDVRFRDFQNHVVHVDDGYWGGAPRVAHQWYDRLQQKLELGNYADAAYAAGVLSHYFTDPIQPLHTGQTDREAIVHRPIEWSINQSYQTIFKQWQDDDFRIVFQLSDSPGWLGEAILHGARFAHRSYSLLVDSYRLERGVRVPQEGLTDEARAALAELFGLAITGWARVIERAASDVEARTAKPIASVNVTAAMVMATIRVPSRMWLRRIESNEERRALALLIEEYRDTGTVVENLPAEVDINRRVTKIYADEKLYRERLAAQSDATSESPATIPMRPAAPSQVTPSAIELASALELPEESVVIGGRLVSGLSDQSALVDAPSIGPKTAARFAEIKVHTIGEFLALGADDLATRLETRWITADTVRTWQTQTRLMCQMDGLRTRDVQLLVGAGITSFETLATWPAQTVFAQVRQFAATSAGLRYLRGAEAPTFDDVRSWRDAAIHAVARHRSSRRAG